MTPLGWSGWDQDNVILSTVRLTWCMMDTTDGAVEWNNMRNKYSWIHSTKHTKFIWELAHNTFSSSFLFRLSLHNAEKEFIAPTSGMHSNGIQISHNARQVHRISVRFCNSGLQIAGFHTECFLAWVKFWGIEELLYHLQLLADSGKPCNTSLSLANSKKQRQAWKLANTTAGGEAVLAV